MATEINKDGMLTESKEREQLVCFTPFESQVLGVDNTHVFLKELVIESEEKAFPCCLKIPRHEYIRVLNLWLDAKRDYCEMYKHFCGVCGSFYAAEYEQDGEINILLWIDDEKEEPVYQDVPLIEVTRFFDECDMEHG